MSFWSKGERPHINKMPDLEWEIREFVRQQHDFHRDDKPPADNPASLLQRATGAQKPDIENVIAELQAMREKLQSEGARVQRRVLDYVTLSQSATQSAKIISETLRNNRPARLQGTAKLDT